MGYLGCADGYIVQFSTKEGKLIGETDRASTVNWNRKLDDYSSASITLDLGANVDSGACCELLNKIDVRRDVMSLYRLMGSRLDMVWTGPIQMISSGREQTTINAVDKFALYENRVLRLTHDNISVDIAAIWNSMIADANYTDPIITDLAPLTGILFDTQQDALGDDMAIGALKVLLEAGLDFTIHRGVAVYGAREIRLQRHALRDDHFLGEILVIQDASKIASQVYVKGYSDDRVDYPNPAATPAIGYYGLVERVFTENNVVGTSSLTDLAIAHYDQMARQKPFFLDMTGGSSLSPITPVDINDLVAGTVFNVSIQDICPPMEAPLRMHEMNASMGTDENVSISLQPLGSTA